MTLPRDVRVVCPRAFAVLALMATSLPSIAAPRSFGESQLFAKVPAPGYPEGVVIRGNRVYVSGPATFGITDPAVVWAYDLATKALVAQYPIKFGNPYMPMRGLSCIAFGPDGKLYAIEPFVGVIQMDLDPANTQKIYAPFPPPPVTGSLANDLAFDDQGRLYVTDSFQGLIYRIPSGGGTPEVWFQDPRLLGNPQLPFGVNGIRFDRNSKHLYISVTVRNDFSGAIYRLPAVQNPVAADLQEFHVYPATQFGPPAPDGITFSKSGRLYVALAGSSQISILRQDGNEMLRLSGPASNGTQAPLPWANPANIEFNDEERSILFTNHASLVPFDPNLFSVIEVFVNEKGEPLP